MTDEAVAMEALQRWAQDASEHTAYQTMCYLAGVFGTPLRVENVAMREVTDAIRALSSDARDIDVDCDGSSTEVAEAYSLLMRRVTKFVSEYGYDD